MNIKKSVNIANIDNEEIIKLKKKKIFIYWSMVQKEYRLI